MTFEEAKATLIENAGGHNEYAAINTWVELSEAADIEINYAEDRIRQLTNVTSAAGDHLFDDQ